VTEPRHDDERLAALLEGRLEGRERDELLAYLATADEDLYVYAKTAAALREMEEEEAEQARQADKQVERSPAAGTRSPSLRPGWRRWKASRVIVPPVLAGLAALVIFMARAGAASSAYPVLLAKELGHEVSAGQAGEWPSSTRGDAEHSAAEAGALLTGLAVAVQTRDSQNTELLAHRIVERFDPRAAAVPSSPIMQIQQRAGDRPTALLPLVSEVTERLMEGMDRGERGYLQLGAWTEAARLATHQRNAAFLRSDETRTMLRRAQRITRGDDDARDALARVRAAREAVLQAPSAPDASHASEWSDLAGRLNELMKAIAS
jgi:hypothetical protein